MEIFIIRQRVELVDKNIEWIEISRDLDKKICLNVLTNLRERNPNVVLQLFRFSDEPYDYDRSTTNKYR